MPNAEAALASSARLILDEIGDPPDLTLVHGAGNRGDELIWAGMDRLLDGLIYYETDLNGLSGARGHTVLLPGSGAFCRAFNDTMPRALAVACMRFERVILLPSSFDPSDDVVRAALATTSGTVFARKPESYRRIASLCDTRLAHDCAFFFDFEPWHRSGSGVLNAFRTDPEAGAGIVPADNDDISLTAASFEDWLERISAHAQIRTDRAHVLIAAALMGKRVEFASSSYHKLPAMVDYALSDFPVRQITRPGPKAADVAAPPHARPRRRRGVAPPRVSAIILTRARAREALRAVDSVTLSDVDARTIVIDNNSAPGYALDPFGSEPRLRRRPACRSRARGRRVRAVPRR